MRAEPIGLYIHVPFCASKCPYCDFYSIPFRADLADAYTRAVCRALQASPARGRGIETLYLGGGTPSLLGEERLIRILEAAGGGKEATLEANPGSAGKLDWKRLREGGYNRVSLGVQSLVGGELSALGRAHTDREAVAAVEAVAAAGFEHISCDVMLGVPGQTTGSLRRTLQVLTALPVDHISAYLLKIEEGTPFHARGMEALCAGEELQELLYLYCVEQLEEEGFRQYEISNFARPGGESKHNLIYWTCGEYLGIGPAAHSFLEGRRFWFPRSLEAFVEAEDPFTLAVDDGEGGGWEEYAMLRLRLAEGLSLRAAAERFPGEEWDRVWRRAGAIPPDLIRREEGERRLFLTPRGFLLSNAVTGKLLYG